MALNVALVSRDPQKRDEMVRRLDGAPLEWRITLHRSAPDDADVVVAAPDVSVDGAIAYEPSVDMVAAVAARGGPRAQRLVIGGLPGSGRTSVAVHLAAALAPKAAVCVLDRDPARGVAWRLGIAEPRLYRAGDDLMRAAVPVHAGFRLVTTEEDIDGEAFRRSGFDRVIVDDPMTLHPDVLMMQPTRPQAARAAERFRAKRAAVVILNRVGRGGETTRRDLERVLARRVTIELPHTPSLRDAEDSGRLVPSRTGWWRAMLRLARALEP